MNGTHPSVRGDGTESGALSSAPEKLWPDGLLFHGARIGLVIALAGLLAMLFPPARQTNVTRYSVDDVAQEQVLAEIEFTVQKTQQELQQDQAEAAATVPPWFELRPEAADTTEVRLSRFFDGVGEAARAGGTEAVRGVLQQERVTLSDSEVRSARQLAILADTSALADLRTAALGAARTYLPSGVIGAAEVAGISTNDIVIRRPDESAQRVNREDLQTTGDFFAAAISELERDDPELEDVLRLILIRFVEHSLEPDLIATGQRQDDARAQVPRTKGQTYGIGAELLRANQSIGPEEVERLDAYYRALGNAGMLTPAPRGRLPLVGAGLVNLLLLLSYGLLLFFFRKEVYHNFRWLLLQAILVAAYVGAAFFIDIQGLPTELLPVAFVVLAVAVLWDGRMAMVLGLLLAVLTGIQPPFAREGAMLVGVISVGASAAALTTRAFRRRAQMWYFIAIVAGAYALFLLGVGLAEQTPFAEVAAGIGAAAINAFLCGILAIGLVSFFEFFTGITTDQTLLEWTDPNRPLLKRLSMEAPGTYAHTINVANFAEAAANAIGANGLLCRVGIYYHDVGKMLKPQYFVENQGGMNPHDRLKPETSAEIVREHVTEGMRLAREAKVPAVILDFIPEHHGTQLISFFYEKAKEENPDEEPDPAKFSYPGPRPRSKETAISMLADSIESAARALKEPSEERIRTLVDGIVASKVSDGQLDESSLTLSELATLRKQFVKMLGSMYHHRIDYPQTRHLTEAPAEGAEGGESGEQPTAERVAAGADQATAAPDRPAASDPDSR